MPIAPSAAIASSQGPPTAPTMPPSATPTDATPVENAASLGYAAADHEALAALTEISKLVLEQMLDYQIERGHLRSRVRRRDARHETIKIFASKPLGPRPALRPIAREVAGVQLAPQQRGGVPADQEADEAERRDKPSYQLDDLRSCVLGEPGFSTPSARMTAPVTALASTDLFNRAATVANLACSSIARRPRAVGCHDTDRLVAFQYLDQAQRTEGEGVDVRDRKREACSLGGRIVDRRHRAAFRVVLTEHFALQDT